MHALIIEDETIIALLIEDQLREIGYTSIAFAVTEADAVAAARARCPDLITADVRLASGCGIAAVQAICSARTVPVVFVTASGGDVRDRLREAVVVPKPFAPECLADAIATVTGAGVGPR